MIKYRFAYIAAIFFVGGLFAGSNAAAQDAPIDDAAAAQAASAALPPQSQGAGLKPLDEIIVTASKREESLQQTLGSVTAVSGDQLERNNVQDFNSLVELVPGMVAQDEEKIAIRGISRTRDGPSPVAFHVNDVFIAMRGEPFYDLEAVEILRGPSGTLFGRNATAGAINAKWRRPEDEWGAGGALRYSTLQEREVKAYLNLPLAGEGNRALLGRLVIYARRNDGTIDDEFAPDDRDPGYIEDQFIRLYLTSEPSDNLSLSLRLAHYDSEGGPFYIVASPSPETRRSGVLEEQGVATMSNDLTKVRSRVRDRFGDGFETYTRIDGQVDWAVDDVPLLGNMDIVLVGGVQFRDDDAVFDLDGTELALTDGLNTVRDDLRRTAELRFVSRDGQGIDWLFGLFWYKQTATETLDVIARAMATASDLGAGPSFPGEPEFPVDAHVSTRGEHILDESFAAFLNMDFELAQLIPNGPDIKLTAGIRQNYDDFGRNTDKSDVIIFDSTLGLGPIPAVDQSDLVQEADFTATTGELAARWFYSDAAMAYGKLSRGYKPGLAQRFDRADGVSVQNPVDPEFLTALELGWKGAFNDRRLRVNLAGYYYDYTDLQVSQITPGGVLTENAGEATIKGVEFELFWLPNDAIFVQLSGAWTDATYDAYCGTDSAFGEDVPTDPGCTEENPMNFSGARLTAAPQFSAAMLASYTWWLGPYGSVSAGIKSSWNDVMDRRGLGNRFDEIDPHSTTDLRLTWDSPEQQWTVDLFAENIEGNDDTFFQAYTPLIQGRDNSFSLINNISPRKFGISLEARF